MNAYSRRNILDRSSEQITLCLFSSSSEDEGGQVALTAAPHSPHRPRPRVRKFANVVAAATAAAAAGKDDLQQAVSGVGSNLANKLIAWQSMHPYPLLRSWQHA